MGLCSSLIDAANGEVRRTSTLDGLHGAEVTQIVVGQLREVFVSDQQLCDWIHSVLIPKLRAEGKACDEPAR